MKRVLAIDAVASEALHEISAAPDPLYYQVYSIIADAISSGQLKPGDRLQIGPDVQLEITNYTIPCDQNAQWFRDRDYKRVSQKKNPGWSRFYAKVLREGVVRPGDAVEILEMSR